MWKWRLAAIITAAVLTGCGGGEVKPETTGFNKEIQVKPIEVRPIETKPIETKPIETETILTETILTENVIVETWESEDIHTW